MENEERKIIKKIDYATVFLKWSGVCVIFTGMFGVGFQKGIIGKTGLENLNGSYDVREIFNSAIDGGMYLISSATAFIDSWSLFWVQWLVSLIISFLCVIVFFFINKYMNRKSSTDKVPEKIDVDGIPRWAFWGAIPLTFSFVITLILLISPFIPIIALMVIILICGFGYFVGESWLIDSLDNKPCNPITAQILEKDSIHQCTQLYFNGERLMGSVILENSDGYIIRRNQSFLFYSKDGSRCFYSKFVNTDKKKHSVGDVSIFGLVDPEITKFCSSKKS